MTYETLFLFSPLQRLLKRVWPLQGVRLLSASTTTVQGFVAVWLLAFSDLAMSTGLT